MSVPLRSLAVAAVATAALVAAPATLARDDDVHVRGACTQGSSVELELSDEDGRIEVELEVDQNRNGVPWRVTLRRNGVVVATRAARTRAPSGSFEVRRIVANGPGRDRISATATRSGETCVVRATWA